MGTESRPGNVLERDPAFVREAIARTLANMLGLKKQDAGGGYETYIADVSFINDWQYAARWSPHDPMNLRVGDYASTRAAELATVRWLHKSKQAPLLHALQSGDTVSARRILQSDYPNPVTHHHMNITHHKLAYPLAGDTGTSQKPKLSLKDRALNDTPNSIADALGGFGDFLKSPVLLIALAVVLVLVLKK